MEDGVEQFRESCCSPATTSCKY